MMIRHGDRVLHRLRGTARAWMVRTMAPLFDASEQMSALSNVRAFNYHLMGGNEVGVTSASSLWRKLRAARTERCSHHLRVPKQSQLRPPDRLMLQLIYESLVCSPCPPPSRVSSPGYAFPQPLTRVTIVI